MAHAIETTELTKYYGSTRGIEDVNLQVEEGEIFGFIGPNGAGKTTTIRTLMDMIFPSSGSARVFGLDSREGAREIKREVGYLPSDDHYYGGMNGRQLLIYSARLRGLGPEVYRTRVEELAERLDLDLSTKIKTLSRGNRRKVSIIKSLLPQAKLLILDEPTSGLDPLMQTRFFELLRTEQDRGTTIFFSSHILSEVQKVCNRVAIIRDGRIVRTDQIDSLAREHVRKVTVVFREGTSPGDIRLSGAKDIERKGNILRFLFEGEAQTLIAGLADQGIAPMVEDFSVERSSLDEIFMGYYGGGHEEAEK